jgi:hypothetical protein
MRVVVFVILLAGLSATAAALFQGATENVAVAGSAPISVLLSSGARQRYRQDILRAISMPPGAILQFRYFSRWVAPSVRAKPSGVRAQPFETCLIAYLDQSDPTRTPEIVPCRFAKVKEIEVSGTTFTVRMALGDYGLAKNLPEVNRELRAAYAGVPHWKGPATKGPDGKPVGDLEGHFWFEASTLASVANTTQEADWEKIVSQLAQHNDYRDERYFFAFRGLHVAVANSTLASTSSLPTIAPSVEGDYVLVPGKEYELRLYHYLPRDSQVDPDRLLTITSSTPMVEFTSNTSLQMDSGYDVKTVRFRLNPSATAASAFLTLAGGDRHNKQTIWWFDLPIRIETSWWGELGIALLVGVVLAGPQITSAISDRRLKGKKMWMAIGWAVLCCCVACVIAALMFRKPLSP